MPPMARWPRVAPSCAYGLRTGPPVPPGVRSARSRLSMVRSCILFTGEGGLFSSGISVPKPGLSMTTLPNLFSTTMALPASDPSGSSSATLADASTVFPSFTCRSVTSPSKCVPRIPMVATATVIRTLSRFLFAMSPLTNRNAPLKTLEVNASSPELPPAAWKYFSTSNSVFGPRKKRDLSLNSICRTVPAPVRMRSPAKRESPSASFRTGPPGACALLIWSPVIRDARPTGVWASATADASSRPRANRLMPTEWSFISRLLDFHPSGARHSAHERPWSQIRTPAVRYACRHGRPHHRDHRHTDARAFFRQFHFHDIERHRHYPSCAGPWLLPRRFACGPQAVGSLVFFPDRRRGLLGPAAAIPECGRTAGLRLQAVPDRRPLDRIFPDVFPARHVPGDAVAVRDRARACARGRQGRRKGIGAGVFLVDAGQHRGQPCHGLRVDPALGNRQHRRRHGVGPGAARRRRAPRDAEAAENPSGGPRAPGPRIRHCAEARRDGPKRRFRRRWLV